jgi:hypothetical protein
VSIKNEEFSRWDSLGPVQPSARPWSPDELVHCEKCQRANSPTRGACLYCGVPLPVTEKSAALRRPVIRSLERGETGYNTVVTHRRTTPLAPETLARLAELLQLEPEQLETILRAEIPLPLARVASVDEAALIVNQLDACGLKGEIVSDENLTAEARPPFRLRSLEFTERSIIGVGFGETDEQSALWDEVILCVVGRVYVNRMEVEERRARGPENEIIETRELDSDETIIDLYTAGKFGNWRIASHSFDFSCLGNEKSLTVAGNVATLLGVVRASASRALYDESYRRFRQALQPVWPIDRHTESRGWRRTRLGGGFSTQAAMVSNNLSQFTSYSRLRYYFVRQSHVNRPDEQP